MKVIGLENWLAGLVLLLTLTRVKYISAPLGWNERKAQSIHSPE